MTRPFAGQRNFGSAPVPSASLTASLSSVSVGAMTAAVCAGSASFTAAEGAGLACPPAAGAVGFAAAACPPGITRRSPTLSVVVDWMLLALAISLAGLLYRRAILLSVSPLATTWTPALLAGIAAATGAGAVAVTGAGAGAAGRVAGVAAAATGALA